MRKFFFLILMTLLAGMTAKAQADYRVVPLPRSINTDTTQVFKLQTGMGIVYDESVPEMQRNVEFLQQWVAELTGLHLQLIPHPHRGTDLRCAIWLSLMDKPNLLPH